MYKPYMITYDLNKPGQDYADFKKTIESFGSYCHYWDSVYLVRTDLSPEGMVDRLTKFSDSNDKLFISELNNNYQGLLRKDQWKFIRENIFN